MVSLTDSLDSGILSLPLQIVPTDVVAHCVLVANGQHLSVTPPATLEALQESGVYMPYNWDICTVNKNYI